MDKTITTALLIVVSMVMALMLFNVAYPAIIEGGDAIVSMADRADDRMKSQIVIIHTAGELNRDGQFYDTNSNGIFEVFIWVKNIGSTRIIGLESLDVFFGPDGNFTRIPHQSAAGGSQTYWTGAVENASEWDPAATMKLTLRFGSALTSGRYFAKVTTASGIFADYFLGM